MKQIALLALLLVALARPASADVVYSVNATDEPLPGPGNWGTADDVGWLYTPTTNTIVTDVGTTFAATFSPPVTVQIFEYLPTTDSNVGPALATGELTPVANTLEFATLNTAPLTLLAGTTYLVGFEGVAGDAFNVTNTPGAVSAEGGVYYDTGDGSFLSLADMAPYDQPILEFEDNAPDSGGGGPVTVPEPSTWALLFGSLAGLAIFRQFRPVRVS